jgi:outer membrane protein assembly factor BamE (lipoprotein component of BamABCDE complex)
MSLRRLAAVLCLVVFVATLVAACGSPEADFNRVDVGMTMDQVKSIMGEPQTKAGAMGAEQWVYKDKYVVQFIGGKVISKATK